HAVIRAAGAEVLISFLHTNHLEFSVTCGVMRGVSRAYTSLPAAAEEATLSRIFAGVHFLFDLTTGQRLGGDIADFIVDNFLTSRERDARAPRRHRQQRRLVREFSPLRLRATILGKWATAA